MAGSCTGAHMPADLRRTRGALVRGVALALPAWCSAAGGTRRGGRPRHQPALGRASQASAVRGAGRASQAVAVRRLQEWGLTLSYPP